MASPFIALVLRLPPDLHARLKALATADRRSLNAQILTLLLEALTARETPRS